jgi:hypothetical protein
MENSKKNNPGKLVLITIGVLVAMIVFYFIILQIFPNLFMTMPTGEAQPVQTNP